jgi:hypothetical protein
MNRFVFFQFSDIIDVRGGIRKLTFVAFSICFRFDD